MNGQASTNQELMNTKSVLDLESLNPPSSTTYPIRIASLWPKSRNFPSSQPVSLASFFTFLFSSFYCELGHAPRPACAALMEAPPSAFPPLPPLLPLHARVVRGGVVKRSGGSYTRGQKKLFCAIFRVALLNDALTHLALFAHQRDRMYLYGRKRRVLCYGATPSPGDRRGYRSQSEAARGKGNYDAHEARETREIKFDP